MTTFHVLTLFPDMIEQGLAPSIIGRAAEKKIIAIHAVDIRSYSKDKHGRVDDYPYGGGAGMLMQAQPVYDAWKAVSGDRKVRTVYMTPQGRPFDQRLAEELAGEEELIFLCGHYEGIDERALEEVVTDYVSIGDYVLTGGELAAMVMIDAVARLIPGVLGNDTSAEEESFHNDLLEYPQYSRPEVWHGKAVPGVLLSGNHKEVGKWRLEQAKARTAAVRPDLYARYEERQRLIGRLAKNKRSYIHIMESLSRGLGDILYAQGEDILICQRRDRSCIINASSPESGAGLLKLCGEAPVELFLTGQGFIRDLLMEKGGSACFSVRQFLYTERAPLTVKHKDIRRLGADSLSYVCGRCPADTPQYLGERLQAGVMYGAFSDGDLIGFIGLHRGGSLGMLYVEEAYRRQGIGQSLEAYAANRLLEQGFTPFVHIKEEDEVSLRLQEKLGFYQAKDTFWWIRSYKM